MDKLALGLRFEVAALVANQMRQVGACRMLERLIAKGYCVTLSFRNLKLTEEQQFLLACDRKEETLKSNPSSASEPGSRRRFRSSTHPFCIHALSDWSGCGSSCSAKQGLGPGLTKRSWR